MPHSIKKKKKRKKESGYLKILSHSHISYLPVHKTLERKVVRFNLLKNG